MLWGVKISEVVRTGSVATRTRRMDEALIGVATTCTVTAVMLSIGRQLRSEVARVGELTRAGQILSDLESMAGDPALLDVAEARKRAANLH